MDKCKVLRLYTWKDIEEFLPQYTFIYPPNRDLFDKYYSILANPDKEEEITKEEIETFINDVILTIKENPDIKGILCVCDVESYLIIAILNSANYLNVRVPTLESFFSLFHKLLHKQLEQDPIKFSFFDIFDENWEDKILPFPFFMKLPLMEGSAHTFIVRNKEELYKAYNYMKTFLPKLQFVYNYITERYLDLKKLPLANKHLVLCEELKENCKFINFDGYVDDEGNIIPLQCCTQIITNSMLCGNYMPSLISDEQEQKQISMCYDLFKKCDFKGAPFNSEFFIDSNDQTYFIESNPRTSSGLDNLHRKFGYEQLDLAIKHSMGHNTISPKIIKSKFAVELLLMTKKDGKVKDLINNDNYLLLKNNPNYLIYDISNDWADWTFETELFGSKCNNGELLFYIYFTKETFQEVCDEIFRIRKEILKKDDYYFEINNNNI